MDYFEAHSKHFLMQYFNFLEGHNSLLLSCFVKLIEAGFEFVSADPDGTQYFRKRK
jgi:hypothetical protein